MNHLFPILSAALLLSNSLSAQDIKFKKTVLDTEFRAEGVTAFDVNHDGKVDLVTDQFWYEAPQWTPHEIAEPKIYHREPNEYSQNFSCYPMDVNHDGYEDLVVVRFPGAPMFWLENPKGKEGHWTPHELFFSAANESPALVDLYKDGKKVMILGINSEKATPDQQNAVGWCSPDPSGPDKPWIWHAISGPGSPSGGRFQHGLGIGDVNGDGRPDLLIMSGWYEAPADLNQTLWTFHPHNFSPDETCAQMYVYDVNGDGLADVICSSAHKTGVWWNEQLTPKDGKERWALHTIDKTFSETHSLMMVDLDGDKIPELITGKRFYSHGKGGEPGWDQPAYLVYYKRVGKGDDATWEKHIIDEDSGVATQFEVTDVNGDGKPDIIVSNKKGLFYFEQLK